jgi:dipeptidyl aminopeptidase/acylaminoacyl peptidase
LRPLSLISWCSGEAGSQRSPVRRPSPSIYLLDLSIRQLQQLRRSSEVEIDPVYLSIPQEIEFPTEGGLTAFAFYYPPANADFRAPAGERPPLLVMSHGGQQRASTAF